jgi:outer membrane protein
LIRTFTFLLCGCAVGYAETYTLTLRQAVDLALRQNPELTVTRLDEQKAAQSVRLAKDPFFPRMFVASGAAYSSGYPLTIDGNPPSIAQAHAVQTFFNRIKTYEVAEARENERTTLIDIDIKRDDIIYRTASLYLDAERATEISEFVARQIQEF